MNADFLLDTTGDLQIANGDLVIGDSFWQEVGLLLQSKSGDWKLTPLLGVNLFSAVNDETDQLAIRQKIKEQLKYDGKKLTRLDYNNGKITIEAV